MASISSLGTGSGIDLESMITKLMSVEKAPLTAINKREASYQANITALGSLKGALASLQTAATALAPGIGQSMLQALAGKGIHDVQIYGVKNIQRQLSGSHSLGFVMDASQFL